VAQDWRSENVFTARIAVRASVIELIVDGQCTGPEGSEDDDEEAAAAAAAAAAADDDSAASAARVPESPEAGLGVSREDSEDRDEFGVLGAFNNWLMVDARLEVEVELLVAAEAAAEDSDNSCDSVDGVDDDEDDVDWAAARAAAAAAAAADAAEAGAGVDTTAGEPGLVSRVAASKSGMSISSANSSSSVSTSAPPLDDDDDEEEEDAARRLGVLVSEFGRC
jgi:hypothetical protein